jgi:hypothetical protein
MDPWMDAAHRGGTADAVADGVVAGQSVGHLLGASGAGALAAPGGEVQRDAPTVSRGGGQHTVVRDDTLWIIARETYGHGRFWRHIRDANRDRVFGDSLIHPGTILDLPVVEVPMVEALHGERGDQAGLRDLARSIPDADYDAFLASLSADERAAEARFLQEVEILRSSGMTLDELADEQRRFLEGEAARGGVTVGQVIRDRVDGEGYGGAPATIWNGLTEPQRRDWERRFNAVVRRVRDAARSNPQVSGVLSEARRRGGGQFLWEPERSEQTGAFAFTRNDFNLYCGMRWVEMAEADPTSVYANIMHEMMGHATYGDPEIDGTDVIMRVIDDLPAADQATATGSANSISSAYGYMETEIFAELYEAQFDRPDNPTDRPWGRDARGRAPHGDVQRQLERMRAAFAPRVAEALVRGLWRRAQLDSRVTPAARTLLAERILAVFGFDPR